LLVHLPLRYEDETRITPVAARRAASRCRSRWSCTAARCSSGRAGSWSCGRRRQRRDHAALLQFLPQPAGGLERRFAHPRLRRVRGGFFGAEMVHPRFRARSATTSRCPELTPIYPTTAGAGQFGAAEADRQGAGRRRPVRDPARRLRQRLKLPGLARSLRFLHHPPPAPISIPCMRAITRPGGASSSTRCWPSNCRCAAPIWRAASRGRRVLARDELGARCSTACPSA
jgi:ATP-dependent DNA helicase RecG